LSYTSTLEPVAATLCKDMKKDVELVKELACYESTAILLGLLRFIQGVCYDSIADKYFGGRSSVETDLKTKDVEKQ